MIASFDPLGGDAHDWHGYYAGFGSRFMAYVVDAILIVVCFYLMAGFAMLLIALATLQKPKLLDVEGRIWLLLFLGWAWAYLTATVWLFDRTPGKALFGLRVASTNGERTGFLRAFVRAPAYLVSYLFFCLGFIWILISKTKRAWHDYIARTCVVYDWDARPAARFRVARERARAQ